MKTGFEIVDILRNYLAGSSLMTDPQKPNGELKKLQRPDNSTAEDVVINLITQEAGPIAEGLLNVNIYAKNLKISTTAGIDESQPDYARLRYLTGLAWYDLLEVWSPEGDYVFEAEANTIEQDTNNQHYSNIRVRFYSIN